MTYAIRFIVVLLMLTGVARAEEAPERTDAERAALEQLASEIDGAIVYTRAGRVLKVTIGQWEPVDLGPGTFARWSFDGKHIAVYHAGRIDVMNADGSDRRALAEGDLTTCSPIEFHSDNRSIIYWRKDERFRRVDIHTGESKPMDLPAAVTGEPGISADGRRLVARGGDGNGPLHAFNLADGAVRQYARGCAPGVSPDGRWVMNNVGSHRELDIRKWDGSARFTLDTRSIKPDRRWDAHHWSNHNDYIAAQGEGEREDAYVVRITNNSVTRVTWRGRVRGPDLWVKLPEDHEQPDLQPDREDDSE